MATYTLGGGRGSKRIATVPYLGRVLGEYASKADLLELAWDYAAQQCKCCDDEQQVARKLLLLLRKNRERNGAPTFRLPKPRVITAQRFAEALKTLREVESCEDD